MRLSPHPAPQRVGSGHEYRCPPERWRAAWLIRFWSLKTAHAHSAQGWHVDGLAVIYRPMGRSHDVCTPTHRSTVQRVGPTSAYPGHYPRPSLLGPSSPRPHPGDPYSTDRIVVESMPWVPPFLMSVLRSRRAVLSTGFVGSEYWSDAPLPAPILSLLGKPGLTRVGLFWVTMGQRTFARAAPSSSLPGVIPSGSGLALFYPRFTD